MSKQSHSGYKIWIWIILILAVIGGAAYFGVLKSGIIFVGIIVFSLIVFAADSYMSGK